MFILNCNMNLQSSLTAFVKKLICNISFDLNVPAFKTGGGGVKNVKQISVIFRLFFVDV